MKLSSLLPGRMEGKQVALEARFPWKGWQQVLSIEQFEELVEIKAAERSQPGAGPPGKRKPRVRRRSRGLADDQGLQDGIMPASSHTPSPHFASIGLSHF